MKSEKIVPDGLSRQLKHLDLGSSPPAAWRHHRCRQRVSPRSPAEEPRAFPSCYGRTCQPRDPAVALGIDARRFRLSGRIGPERFSDGGAIMGLNSQILGQQSQDRLFGVQYNPPLVSTTSLT
jgi:hypothetical protein